VEVSETDLPSLGTIRHLRAGTILIRQFDKPGPMYFVRSGTVRIVRMSPGAPQEEIARLEIGDHVGEVAAMLDCRGPSPCKRSPGASSGMSPDGMLRLISKHADVVSTVDTGNARPNLQH
jgi:CRP-like cAMP-binding protein